MYWVWFGDWEGRRSYSVERGFCPQTAAVGERRCGETAFREGAEERGERGRGMTQAFDYRRADGL
jgi:hypothetical protein